MLKVLKQDGFASLIEVLVTAVIFVVASLGIFTTISMLRPHGVESAKRLEAAYVGKRLVEELRGKVDARVWDCSLSPIYPGNHGTIVNGLYADYVLNWHIADDPSGVRSLTMNINYP